ncbi:site-2 protease family protein [Candidatus Woesearchaeota archaeon]|nr:site-2 protease family protein [Candidatus Woesearchaeota archaeon]
MLDFQTIAAVVFLIALTIFVFLKRKNLDTKQIIPYLLYFSMYKTKLGLKLMDSLAKKHRKLMIYIGYAGILVGFLGMILISYGLISNIYVLFTKPEAMPGVGLVLPFKAKGIFFVPFFYWIISIFVIAAVHEFSHGLIARANNLKVKSSGFAFLGLIVPIIPAAFVEPDEKELRKRPHKEQLSVFAAGPFSNIAIAFLFLAIASLILAPIANAVIEANGVKVADYVKVGPGERVSSRASHATGPFPAESSGIKIGEIIQQVDDKSTPYVENLSTALRSKKPNDAVKIKTDKSSYEIKLAKNPDNESLAYLGAYLEQSTKIKDNIKTSYGEFLPKALIWIYGLFVILFVLNLGIGLFNLVPIGPLDGGRMLQLVLHRIFDKKNGNKVWYYIGMFFLILILINITAGFVR